MLFLLEAEVVTELFAPPWAFGVFALAVLLGLLAFVRGIGQGRPHS